MTFPGPALASERVPLYVRALRAAVHALAPDADHVSAAAIDAHLHALDPALSGPVLLPAELDPQTGLPGLVWLDRVRAELQALEGRAPVDPQRLQRVAEADPELGERLAARRRLQEWLLERPLIPDLSVEAVLLRDGPSQRVLDLRVDRQLPGSGWIRLRAEVAMASAGRSESAGLAASGAGHLPPGLASLLARHILSPLVGVHRILQDSAQLTVRRVSRGCIGPFWFPGGPQPDGLPAWAASGFALHQSLVVLSPEVRGRVHQDPWGSSGEGEPTPAGFGVYRTRRFAVSPLLVDRVRRWSLGRVGCARVVAVRPG